MMLDSIQEFSSLSGNDVNESENVAGGQLENITASEQHSLSCTESRSSLRQPDRAGDLLEHFESIIC